MLIRDAVLSDYDAVDEMLRDLGRIHKENVPGDFSYAEHTYTEEQFEDMISSEDNILICAEEDGKTVGYCHLMVRESCDITDELSVHVAYIVVDGEYRGRGIARALMAESERRAKETEAKQFNLQVWDFNTGAKKLYESFGMTYKESGLPYRTFMIKEI